MTDKVTVAQRRARLLARHRLADPAGSVTEAAEAMIALHATDPLTVYLSAWARVDADSRSPARAKRVPWASVCTQAP